MTNLERIYDDVFRRVYPQIRECNSGLLFTTIYIILEGREADAKEICAHVGIRRDAEFEKDKEIANDLISRPVTWKELINIREGRKMDTRWIVIIACTLVGVISCILYLENPRKIAIQKNRADSQQAPFPPSDTLPVSSLTAALCLVVPAFAIGSWKEYLSLQELEKLIDSASYFLCTTIEDADLKQKNLQVIDAKFTFDNNQEMYLRIHISDGQEMINKKATYILKRNIPSHGQGLVVNQACLKSLSGLEAFNRI